MPSENKKVINATKTTVDGVQYDSKLEAYMAGLMQMHQIHYEFQVSFEIQPPFKYRGKKIRPVNMIVDFLLNDFNMIVDTKGHQTKDNKIKMKMLKYNFFNTGKTFDIRMPRTKSDCQKIVREIVDLKEKAHGQLRRERTDGSAV